MNSNIEHYFVKEGDSYSFTRSVSTRELVTAATIAMDANASIDGEIFTNPEEVMRYFKLKIGSKKREVFAVMFLNTRHRLIAFEKMFQGTIDGASVHPCEIARRALQLYSTAIIIGHNHPSGNTEPSRADEQITARIKEALNLLDIRLLDHIIVSAGSESTSLAQRGLA